MLFLSMEAREDDPGMPARLDLISEDGTARVILFGNAEGAGRRRPRPGGRATNGSCRSGAEVPAVAALTFLGNGEKVYSRDPARDAGLLGRLPGTGKGVQGISLLDVGILLNMATLPLYGSEHRPPLSDAIAVAARAIDVAVSEGKAASAPGPCSDARQMWRTWCCVRAEVQRVVGLWAARGAGPLFHASKPGRAASVSHATETELADLAGTSPVAEPSDRLDGWSLVTVRDGNVRLTVHALGWKGELANAWITSPLVWADPIGRVVSTSSGHTYRLGAPDRPSLQPDLRSHLARALRTWGFADVRG